MGAITTDKTVTGPYEARHKPVGRDGRYPWAVTLKDGCRVETRTFWADEHADAEGLVADAVAAGFKRLG